MGSGWVGGGNISYWISTPSQPHRVTSERITHSKLSSTSSRHKFVQFTITTAKNKAFNGKNKHLSIYKQITQANLFSTSSKHKFVKFTITTAKNKAFNGKNKHLSINELLNRNYFPPVQNTSLSSSLSQRQNQSI